MQTRNTLWISYSGISDFEACPRLYYLRNLYTTPVTQRKVQVADPFLTLGTVVHRVTEEIAFLSPERRKEISLMARFERIWQFFSGKRGGFHSPQEEQIFYERGKRMVAKLESSEIIYSTSYCMEGLPKLKLFEGRDDIMLVGSIDWIQVLPNGGLHVIDFKTGKNEEDEHSLQLPIYFLLGTSNLQGNIEKVSYWYLEKDDGPVEMTLKSPEFYLSLLREKAQEIKKAIDNGKLICRAQSGRCQKCEKYEKIISKEAEFVGFDRKMKREIYYIENSKFQIPNSN